MDQTDKNMQALVEEACAQAIPTILNKVLAETLQRREKEDEGGEIEEIIEEKASGSEDELEDEEELRTAAATSDQRRIFNSMDQVPILAVPQPLVELTC